MTAASHLTMVAVLAGRRIDAPGVPPARFPLDHAPAVRAALVDVFARYKVVELVCSAACGADLIALSAAEDLGIHRRIVLPFDAAAFRLSSVVDRPGDWGELYDRLVADARASGDLIVLDAKPGDEHAYSKANQAIIREAALGSHHVLAVLVWEGRSRSGDDATEEFRRLAAGVGFEEVTILTC